MAQRLALASLDRTNRPVVCSLFVLNDSDGGHMMLARHTGPAEALSATTSCPVEAIAAAYLSHTSGDPVLALRCAITDALADLLEVERRTRERSRLISRGYVRGCVGDTGDAL